MICPKCGFVNTSIPTPNRIKEATKLGNCQKCSRVIFAQPTTKRTESSQIETVQHGESREDILLPIYLKYHPGCTSKKRKSADDIDREILNESNKIIHFMEIKERSNTLNAYRNTQFPYAKIETAERLYKEFELPIYFIIKFTDCWTRHTYSPTLEYRKGDKPFAPRYRPWQNSKSRQIPVMIDVETLEILPWRELCN